MESAHLLEGSLFCCYKCKGLFTSQEDRMKHQVTCMGNPAESSCAYFACERKIFLQLFQPEDFLLEGCDQPFFLSKDDSFINHFVKVRMPDIFDPTIFLKATPQPNTTDSDDSNDTNFLLESNINTLENPVEDARARTFLDTDKPVNQTEQDKIQSIINKNIEYLKGPDLPSLSVESSKGTSFSTQNLPRLFSPIDKHLHFFGDGTKSRVHSPFERSSGFLQDSQIYGSGSFMYSSNPSIPQACDLSADLFSGIPFQPDDNQPFTATTEESSNLKYLDLAKKDPFFGQNPGLCQTNLKDPYLINASIKPAERPFQSGLQKSHLTRSCEDIASPTLHIQESNYFNFPSTLDEPTQLDYLDLATLDFLTNPNLISYSQWFTKERSYEKDDVVNKDDGVTYQGQSSLKPDSMSRLGKVATLGSGSSSAFSKIKNKKMLFKKSKSDLQSRDEFTSQVRESFEGLAEFQESLGKLENCEVQEILKSSSEMKRVPVPEKEKEYRLHVFRKRKLDVPKVSPAVQIKMAKPTRKTYERKRRSSESAKSTRPVKIFNVREKLTQFSEEEKDNMKAVLGQSGCIFVKKKRSVSCDEPVVFVNDLQAFGPDGKLPVNKFTEQKTQESLIMERNNLLRNQKSKYSSASKALGFLDQTRAKKLMSVLLLKCQECSFKCRSVVELKNHKALHTRSQEPLARSDVNSVQKAEPVQSSACSGHGNSGELLKNLESTKSLNQKSLSSCWADPDENTVYATNVNIETSVNEPVSLNSFDPLQLQTAVATSTLEQTVQYKYDNLKDETFIATEVIQNMENDVVRNQEESGNLAIQNNANINKEFSIKELSGSVTDLTDASNEDMNLFPELSESLDNQFEPELDSIREEPCSVEEMQETGTRNLDNQIRKQQKESVCEDFELVHVSNTASSLSMHYSPDRTSQNQTRSSDLFYSQSTLTRSLSLQLDLNESVDDMTRIKNELGIGRTCGGQQPLWLHPCSQNLKRKASSVPYIDSLDAVIKPLFEEGVSSQGHPVLTDLNDTEVVTSVCPTGAEFVPSFLQTDKPSKGYEDPMDDFIGPDSKTSDEIQSKPQIKLDETAFVNHDCSQNGNCLSSVCTHEFDVNYTSADSIRKSGAIPADMDMCEENRKEESEEKVKGQQGVIPVQDQTEKEFSTNISDFHVSLELEDMLNEVEQLQTDVDQKDNLVTADPSNVSTVKSASASGDLATVVSSPKVGNISAFDIGDQATLFSESQCNSTIQDVDSSESCQIIGTTPFVCASADAAQTSSYKTVLASDIKADTVLTRDCYDSPRVQPLFSLLSCKQLASDTQSKKTDVCTFTVVLPQKSKHESTNAVVTDGDVKATQILQQSTSSPKASTSDEIYYCETEGCNFSTMYSRNLMAHYQSVHLQLQRFKCDQCTFTTPRSSSLKHHIQQKHLQEKRFQCPECQFRSLFRNDVVKHVKTIHHQQKQYMCNQCTYKTDHTQSLKLHLMQHGGIRPYKCSACPYQVNTPSRVWRHIKTVHKDFADVTCEKSDMTFKVDAKQFRCVSTDNNEDIHVIDVWSTNSNQAKNSGLKTIASQQNSTEPENITVQSCANMCSTGEGPLSATLGNTQDSQNINKIGVIGTVPSCGNKDITSKEASLKYVSILDLNKLNINKSMKE